MFITCVFLLISLNEVSEAKVNNCTINKITVVNDSLVQENKALKEKINELEILVEVLEEYIEAMEETGKRSKEYIATLERAVKQGNEIIQEYVIKNK